MNSALISTLLMVFLDKVKNTRVGPMECSDFIIYHVLHHLSCRERGSERGREM